MKINDFRGSKSGVLSLISRNRMALVPAAAALLLAVGADSGRGTVEPEGGLQIAADAGNAILTWFGEPGYMYQVEAGSDLGGWGPAGEAVVGAGSQIPVTVPAGGHARRFFRLRRTFTGTVQAVFDPSTGVLTIEGDDADNVIVVGRNNQGTIYVNDGAVEVAGGTPAIGNVTQIVIRGGDGDDRIELNEANGELLAAKLEGGPGNDVLIGGSGDDELLGGPGSDTLYGMDGGDVLSGGDGDDVLIGGRRADTVFGNDGSDRMIWHPGDGTDLNEGGAGLDVVEVHGDDVSEGFAVTANGSRVRFERVNPAPFSIDIGTSEHIILRANGGNDRFSASGDLAALIALVIDGGDGDDTLLGSNGDDLLFGGAGNDLIDGQEGNDWVLLGDGDDTFRWDPGDGSDTVEGDEGTDTLLFNDSVASETFEIFPDGSRIRLTRNVGNVVMDVDGIEVIDLLPLNGADIVKIRDTPGTALSRIHVNLAAAGGDRDQTSDIVDIIGTPGNDFFSLSLPEDVLFVSGLSTVIEVKSFEANLDVVRIHGHEGNDIVDASAMLDGPALIADGGPGDDILLGSAATDQLIGNDGDDVLLGNGGIDVLEGGPGDNVVIQDGGNVTGGIVSLSGGPEDDTIRISRDAGGTLYANGNPIPGATVANTLLIRLFGGAGNDRLEMDESGGELPPAILLGGDGDDILIGGSRADQLFGGAGVDTLYGGGGDDICIGGGDDDVLTGGTGEDACFGGAGNDRIIWNPGDGTDMNEGGAGDDRIEVNGSADAETFTATANGTRVRFDRLAPAPFAIDIGSAERLIVNAGEGDDTFAATGNLAALIAITVDGGPGNDTLRGSNGADTLIGGPGDDVILGGMGADTVRMGAGDDTFYWNPGDGSDLIEGDEGGDTLIFNGSSAAEAFAVSSDGPRLLVARSLGNIALDVNGIEALEIHANDGADSITINDVTGTGLNSIHLNIEGFGGAGDNASDTITINGTPEADLIAVTVQDNRVRVGGLPATVVIRGSEPSHDMLVINGGAGADAFSVDVNVTDLIRVDVNQ